MKEEKGLGSLQMWFLKGSRECLWHSGPLVLMKSVLSLHSPTAVVHTNTWALHRTWENTWGH